MVFFMIYGNCHTFYVCSSFVLNMHLLITGKHFLRAGQMNTNIATWARLLKRAAPPTCSANTFSPNNMLNSISAIDTQ